MKFGEYKFKFYLNASHSIYINGKQGENHPHTWEFTIVTLKAKTDFIQFDYIEKEAERLFSVWQDKNLNNYAPFDKVNPTLENICMYFEKNISQMLEAHGWLLCKIEVSESPARSYIIDRSDETQQADELEDIMDVRAEILIDELLKTNKKTPD